MPQCYNTPVKNSPDKLSPFVNEPKPLLIILSGPSGVGKDAVFSQMKQSGHLLHCATTITTRSARPTEQNGIDYHFITAEEFKQKVTRKQLLEWAEVYGNYYGVPKREIEPALERGQDVMVKVDVQGAATLKRLYPEAVAIFLMPPSETELVRRLKQRHSLSEADFDRRLKTAREEIKSLPLFDYVVINHKDRLDHTISQIEAIITAEKCRKRPK